MDPKGLMWLFNNKYHEKGGAKPLYTGHSEVTKETLDKMNERMEQSSDGKIKLEAAAWVKKSSSSDKNYLFVTFDVENLKYANNSSNEEPRQIDDDDVPF